MWIIPQFFFVLQAVFVAVSPAFLIRFMMILRKCNSLHPNCKLFFFSITMALMFPVIVSIVEIVIEVVFVHQMKVNSFHYYSPPMFKNSFGMTSFLFFSMSIERLFACLKAPRFSSQLHTFALFGLSSSLIGSSVLVYAERSEYFRIQILFIYSSFDILALILFIFTIIYAVHQFRTIEYMLNCRVQLTEVIQVSKCVLPALILGVPIKLSEPLLALYDIVDTPLELTSSIFLVYSILVPFSIMVCNREMRGHFIPCCRSKITEVDNKKRDSEKYFNHFNRTIEVKKKTVRQPAKVNTYRI